MSDPLTPQVGQWAARATKIAVRKNCCQRLTCNTCSTSWHLPCCRLTFRIPMRLHDKLVAKETKIRFLLMTDLSLDPEPFGQTRRGEKPCALYLEWNGIIDR